MIRVLVVDDSAVVRALIRDVLERDPDIRVVAEADNGRQAVELARAAQPDLITMDVTMPIMDGLEATSEIMAKQPTPILVVTASLDREQTDLSFQAVQRGALGTGGLHWAVDKHALTSPHDLEPPCSGCFLCPARKANHRPAIQYVCNLQCHPWHDFLVPFIPGIP